MNKPLVKINNWKISYHPLTKEHVLNGTVNAHPKLGYCDNVVTSPILKLDFVERIAETMNTIYQLENPVEGRHFIITYEEGN